MNRLYIAVGAFLLIVVLAWVALSQHDGKLKASIRADTATQVIAEAVQASKDDLRADAQISTKKAVALDAVRAAALPLRKLNVQERPSTVLAVQADEPGAIDPAGATWLSVFNDAVRASNAAIESSGSVSGEM